MKTLAAATGLALSICLSPASAASVYRCSDGQGHVTFTRHGCPANEHTQRQDATNQPPGSGRAVPLAKPAARRRDRRQADDSLTVVGEREDGCGNRLTPRERRSAIIAQRVRPGMTRADVESTFGKPDAISSRNGQLQYRYSNDKDRSRTVNFDEQGCVRGKR